MVLAQLNSDQPDTLISFCCGDVSQMGYGGRHRTMQLQDILFADDKPHRPAEVAKYYSRLSRVGWSVRALKEFGPPIPLNGKMLSHSAHVFHQISDVLKAHPQIRLVILEGTGGAAPLMAKAMRRAGRKALMIPQNLESIVPNAAAMTHDAPIHERLRGEVDYMSAADAVFCISPEEQWLLEIMGINADYLPYYPPQEVVEKMISIRQARTDNAGERDGFLLLGNVGNPPTAQGFRDFYRLLSVGLPDEAVTIHVAGAGTEVLREEFTDPRFKTHGTVSSDSLRYLMSTTRALITHQAPTSGTLTRVVEGQIAGLPIIGNAAALKSARERSGIGIYADAEELRQCLRHPPSAPEIPPYPGREVQLFRRRVAELLA